MRKSTRGRIEWDGRPLEQPSNSILRASPAILACPAQASWHHRSAIFAPLGCCGANHRAEREVRRKADAILRNAELAGIRHIGWYTLRPSFASYLVMRCAMYRARPFRSCWATPPSTWRCTSPPDSEREERRGAHPRHAPEGRIGSAPTRGQCLKRQKPPSLSTRRLLFGVPRAGFEPAHLSAPPPQDGVSTSSTTWAFRRGPCTGPRGFTQQPIQPSRESDAS